MAEQRIEKDSMGERELPPDAYYGIQTLRAVENFPISGLKPLATYVDACLLIKKATAIANTELNCIPPDIGQAIVQAADEILQGNLRDQFVVDIYQAGAGTSHHMNINEVLANRALEILGDRRGGRGRRANRVRRRRTRRRRRAASPGPNRWLAVRRRCFGPR